MNLKVPAIAGGTGERQLTGRMVLAMLVGFFGLVMVVNIFMIRAAVSTFGGVDTPLPTRPASPTSRRRRRRRPRMRATGRWKPTSPRPAAARW